MIQRGTQLFAANRRIGVRTVKCIGFFKSIKIRCISINTKVRVCLKKYNRKKFEAAQTRTKTTKKIRIGGITKKKMLYT